MKKRRSRGTILVISTFHKHLFINYFCPHFYKLLLFVKHFYNPLPSEDCESVEGQKKQNSGLGTPSGRARSFLRQLDAGYIGMAEEGEVEEEEGKKM